MSESADLIEVKVDGVSLQVPKGTLAIRAAEQAGVFIPRFCDHPLLKPVAACRACLVEVATPTRDGEIRKMPKPQPACATACSPGMEIYTQESSPVSAQAQCGILEFMLVNHPLDCPVCDKAGECPLQNQVLSQGPAASRFSDSKRTYPKPLALTSNVLLDRERCILCQRCVRFGKEISGDAVLDLQGRGSGSSPRDEHEHMGEQIGAFDTQVLDYFDEDDNPDHRTTSALGLGSPTGAHGVIGQTHAGHIGLQDLDNSGRVFSSYFSGNLVQICPVGALTSNDYRFQARPFDLISTPAITDADASGAAIRIDARRGKVTRRLAGFDPQVNEEWISDKDRYAYHWQSRNRLATPLLRKDGTLVPVSWGEATEAAAKALIKAREAKGSAFLTGSRLTLEDTYVYSKFARLFAQSNLIDNRVRFVDGEENSFLRSRVAGSGLGVTYADIEAAKQILIVGLEAEDECATLFLRLRKAALKGTKITVVAPWTTRGSAKMKATVITAAPGSEPGIIDSITTGQDPYASLRENLSQPGALVLVGERAGLVTGQLSALDRLLKQSGARLAWIPRRAGERAALEAGAFPGLLPGGRPLNDAAARADVAAVWGVDCLPQSESRCVRSILNLAAGGELSALVLGGIDARDLPDSSVLFEAIDKVDTVIQLEVVANKISEKADIVFPVAPSHEKTGTFINWEGRLRPFGQALASRTQPDWKILVGIAKAGGVDLKVNSVKEILAEYHELSTWDGARAQFEAREAKAVAQPEAGQMLLATHKQLLDAGVCLDGADDLNNSAHIPVARLNGVAPGAKVRVSTPNGTIEMPVADADLPPGVIWLPQCSTGCLVNETLRAQAGSLVSVSVEVK